MEKTIDHICVCLCTFRRNGLLINNLTTLQNINIRNDFTYSVIVVDNDINESAKKSTLQFIKSSKVTIDYYNEPEQNISLARNKSLKHANGSLIAFIDDDEFADVNWLMNLFNTLKNYKVDGVLGPVRPHFQGTPPSWIIKGKFYEKPTHPTGYILKWHETRTSNALIKSNIVESEQDWFRSEFGRGGEDKDFFRRQIEKGKVFVWCNEAVVYETIPPERWTRSFMIKRALLRGKMSLLSPDFSKADIAKSFAAILIYTSVLPFMLLAGHHYFMKYMIKNFDHIGKILAVMGIDIIKQKYVIE